MNKATNGKAGRGLGAAPGSATVKIYRFMPDKPPKGWKLKMGTIGWKGDELYIPAGAAGMSDTEALLCLGYDGTPACFVGDVLLIPEKWARREKPRWKDVYDAIRKRALEMREPPNTRTQRPECRKVIEAVLMRHLSNGPDQRPGESPKTL